MGYNLKYKIEDDLIKKSRPMYGSRRYKTLQDICIEKRLWPCLYCERCGAMLINPQSILIHQGKICQSLTKEG